MIEIVNIEFFKFRVLKDSIVLWRCDAGCFQAILGVYVIGKKIGKESCVDSRLAQALKRLLGCCSYPGIRHKPAVYRNHCARNKAGCLFIHEPQQGAKQIVRYAEAAHGGVGDDFIRTFSEGAVLAG